MGGNGAIGSDGISSLGDNPGEMAALVALAIDIKHPMANIATSWPRMGLDLQGTSSRASTLTRYPPWTAVLGSSRTTKPAWVF